MKRTMIAIVLLITLFFATNVYASDLYITKGGWFGAINKKYFDLLAKNIDDLAAVQKMMDDGVIFIMKEGQEVYIENQSCGVVELSQKGEVFTFWTFGKAIVPARTER